MAAPSAQLVTRWNKARRERHFGSVGGFMGHLARRAISLHPLLTQAVHPGGLEGTPVYRPGNERLDPLTGGENSYQLQMRLDRREDLCGERLRFRVFARSRLRADQIQQLFMRMDLAADVEQIENPRAE